MPPKTFKTYVQGLSSATTPLAGTEPAIIIQGNAVVQCVADDFGEIAKPVSQQPSNFTLSASVNGTTFTDTGSSGQVNISFEDVHPIGQEFSFFVTDNAIQLEPHTISHTIQFWDGSNSRNTGWVLLDAPGKSITIKKISATVWAATAVNGAVDYD